MIAAFNAGAAALGLRNASGQPLRFVPQDELPEGRAYEEFIGATGCVPTRDNLHDFFNALVWLTFPRIKQQLNALQSAQIALAGVGKSRGPARDGATIFDENSALLVVRDSAQGRALVDALRGHRWQEAFCQRRAAFGARRAGLAVRPRADGKAGGAAQGDHRAHPRGRSPATTTSRWRPTRSAPGSTTQVAGALAAEPLSTACFTPLPVLGVPGWWPQQDDEFYADTSVFRPKRAA